MSKILVLGANGMLGGSLLRFFSERAEYEVLGSVRTEYAAKKLKAQGVSNVHIGVDVSDSLSLTALFQKFVPDYVMNCVGVIKQLDQAKAPVPSIEINSLLPHKLAQLCDKIEAKLIHFSTDCVFSGAKGMYLESDVPDAFDLYGRSKLLGEVDYGEHLTLRTSIIGHEIASSVSLVDWYLSQSGSVKGFSKAVFSGLPTIYVAEFLNELIQSDSRLTGLYHLSVDPIDKYSLLTLIKSRYITDVEIIEYPEFEIDRSLNSDKLRNATGFAPPSWQVLIEKMHNEYERYFS